MPQPRPFGPFMVVKTAQRVSLDFVEDPGEISRQHHAFPGLKASSIRSLAEFESADQHIGLIHARNSRARSILTMADAVSISAILPAICSRSLRVLMVGTVNPAG
jgi:hypothetical protein